MIPEPLSAFLINIVASVSLGRFKTFIEKDAKQEINTVVDKTLQKLINNNISCNHSGRFVIKIRILYIDIIELQNKIFKTFFLEPFPVSLRREMIMEKILFYTQFVEIKISKQPE